MHLITITTSEILNRKCHLHYLEEEIHARWVSTSTQQNVDYFQIFQNKCPTASDYSVMNDLLCTY